MKNVKLFNSAFGLPRRILDELIFCPSEVWSTENSSWILDTSKNIQDDETMKLMNGSPPYKALSLQPPG